ncbi:tetratricopeptide repeat protein [Occallatibacter riparius]|uniref:Tetratricopeptide repeat protein n=1 Tax=Occallatibacter riparius TaxID=1002689 RepID=A0A9J7BYU5_9BACT|nr:tetratricopeptide repeat protein [Occallatibacter riparius]UWZ86590.1 tetratricopeptide repeat protein [Occallatibacter riparius]
MSRKFRLSLFIPLLAGALCCAAQEPPKQKLDQQYQSAVADYEAGRYAQAAARLEPLLPYAPNSFEIHELLGMVYASLPDTDKAIAHLKTAVQLKPDSGEARTNLGATLLRFGQKDLAGEQFRKAAAMEPKSYDANHNLGEYYIQIGKVAEAQPYLQQAYKINPNAYDNGYDLAMANFLLGRFEEARTVVQALLQQKNNGELHNLLGQIDEKDGKFVAAANDYEAAAHLDPSEENLFAWGSEMLLHRTYEPAIAIFQKASELYPKSPRILIGLGLALYSRGIYDKAVNALIAAADLNPQDARCYVFLSKAYNSSPLQADEVVARFKRYAELKPDNALAQYYYAVSLWKGKRVENSNVDPSTVEALLKKAISLDDSMADAHLQLGNFYADQHQYEQSIPEYQRALQLDPNLADAHYRLATDLVHTGQKENAQKEFAVYQKLRAEHLAEVQKEHEEVRQFVYSEQTANTERP